MTSRSACVCSPRPAPTTSPGLLASASTRTTGIAQLSDVTATVLQRGGVRPETPISGRAVSVVPSANNSESTAAAKLTVLTDVDTKADAMRRVIGPFLLIWLIGTALTMLTLWIMLRRSAPWNQRLARQRVLRLVRVVGSSEPVCRPRPSWPTSCRGGGGRRRRPC